jgi:CubicO group peptidase (beta-lactamase class C family)
MAAWFGGLMMARSSAIFRIYSMTKAIVSAAALILVDEGKLRLDAPVAELLPEFRSVRTADPEWDP